MHSPGNGQSSLHASMMKRHSLVKRVPQQSVSGSSSAGSTSSGSGSCTSLYQNPSAGEKINAYDNYDIKWDCACLDSVSTIDITLYQYGGGALHGWTNVPCADNSFTTIFNPTWWNSTTSQNLQLQIVESGQPVWATTTSVGPSFQVNWNGTVPASHTGSARNGTSTGVVIESVGNKVDSGVSGGKLAAAVTIPLIAAAIAVLAYIVYSRKKGKKQRKRWSAYVDHRFSQYSGGAAQSEHDVSGSPGRPSMAEVAGRPSISGLSVRTNNNFAGVGIGAGSRSEVLHAPSPSYSGTSARTVGGGPRPASSFYALDGHSAVDSPPATGEYNTTSHLRQLSNNPAYADRVSKVSFADSSFTKGDKRTSYFAYPHNGPGSASSPNHHRYKSSLGNSISMPRKPAQAAGSPDLASGIDTQTPHSLSNRDINGLLSRSITANDESTAPILPQKSSATPKKHNITVSTSMPFMPPDRARDTILSPDDLLAAYASNRALAQTAGSAEEDDEAVRSSAEEEGGPGSASNVSGMTASKSVNKGKFGFAGFHAK